MVRKPAFIFHPMGEEPDPVAPKTIDFKGGKHNALVISDILGFGPSASYIIKAIEDKWGEALIGWGFKPSKKKDFPEIPKPGEKGGPYRQADMRAYKRALESELSYAASKGWTVKFISGKELNRLCYDPRETRPAHGYEVGNLIYLSKDSDLPTQVYALGHEVTAKKLKTETGKTHEELEDYIYKLGERVADAYVSKAMRELRRSDATKQKEASWFMPSDFAMPVYAMA